MEIEIKACAYCPFRQSDHDTFEKYCGRNTSLNIGYLEEEDDFIPEYREDIHPECPIKDGITIKIKQ